MKKLLIIFMLAALSVAGMAGQTKTGTIQSGYTSISRPFLFTAADSIAGRGGSFIVTSDSLVISIANLQKYLQHQTITTSIVKHSGTPSVVVTLRGRVTSTDNWHPIGTPVTWSTSADNPATITSTVPLGYNYLKVSYVASGATQCTQVTAFEIRTANSLYVGSSSAMVIGNGSGTIAVNSSDWDISATGAMTGIGAITSDGLITSTSGLTLGALGSSEVHPALTIIGDADSDAADTDESLTVHLTANSTPTSAVWAFTSTQSAGYTFDKAVSVTGAINQAIAGGTVVTSVGLLGGGGTATNATQTLGAAGGKAFSYYLSSTSTTASDNLIGYYMNVNYGTSGSSAAPSGDVIRGRAWLVGDAAGGTALTGGAFTVELAASSASNTGLTAGLRGNVVLPAGVLTNSGTYYGTMAEVYLGGASTDTRAYTTISPLGIVISGTEATDVAQLSNMVAMDISVPANMVTADGTLVVTGATGAVAAGLKIRINGTDYWIMLATADQ